jgi:hypothetical protein
MSQQLYKTQAQPGQGPQPGADGAAPGGGAGKEDVIDAEYEVKK